MNIHKEFYQSVSSGFVLLHLERGKKYIPPSFQPQCFPPLSWGLPVVLLFFEQTALSTQQCCSLYTISMIISLSIFCENCTSKFDFAQSRWRKSHLVNLRIQMTIWKIRISKYPHHKKAVLSTMYVTCVWILFLWCNYTLILSL